MKKLLLSFIAFCLLLGLAALVVLPYGLGFMAQKKYVQILDALPKSNMVQMTLLDYQRGWFSSDATVKLTLQLPKYLDVGTNTTLILKQHIEHGPVFSMTAPNGEKQLGVGQMLVTTHANSSFGVLNLIGHIQLNGKLVGWFDAPTLQYEENTPLRNNSVAFNGISGMFTLSPDLQEWVSHAEIRSMLVKTAAFTQRAAQIQFGYHLKKSESGLFLGKRTCAIDSMTWDAAFIPTKIITFKGMQLIADDAEKNKKISSQMNATVQYVTLQNTMVGPQQLIMRISDLDAPALSALIKKLPSLRDPKTADYQQYWQLCLDVLTQGLTVQVEKLALVTPWGSPSLVANIQIPPQAAGTLMGLIMGTNMQVDIHLPAPFLMRVLEAMALRSQAQQLPAPPADAKMLPPLNPAQIAQQQITQWRDKKWLLPQGDGYQMHIQYQNQQMTINDQPITHGT